MKTTTQHKIARLLAAASLVALTSPALRAADQSSANSLGQVAQADKVYGNQVLTTDNQKVGHLNNLMIDIESGRILYGVIGAGKERVAVVPEVFTSTLPVNGYLHVNVDKQKIENAPKFTSEVDKPDQWGQASFVSQVYQYFGQNPWWQGSGPANQGSFNNVHKASEVIGMKVENSSNQRLGKINNVIVDLTPGRVPFLILQPESSLNLGNNLYVLPPQAFTLSSDHKNLVSGIDAQKLAAAPHFDKSHWPNLSDPAFASQVYQYYGKEAYFQSGSAPQPTGR